jgi:hypothetical protein
VIRRLAHVVEQFVADMRASDGVHPITGITGLPGTQCFARPNAGELLDEPNPPLSWLRVVWPFKCVARADRYAFAAFSENERTSSHKLPRSTESFPASRQTRSPIPLPANRLRDSLPTSNPEFSLF